MGHVSVLENDSILLEVIFHFAVKVGLIWRNGNSVSDPGTDLVGNRFILTKTVLRICKLALKF